MLSQGFADERKRRDLDHDLTDRAVDRLAPRECQLEVGVARRFDRAA